MTPPGRIRKIPPDTRHFLDFGQILVTDMRQWIFDPF
jgi:hypothetical protein